MNLLELTADEYAALYPSGCLPYSSASFSQLNASKVERVAYVAFERDRHIVGCMTLGLRDGVWCSSFSAPFGGVQFVGEPNLEDVIDIYTLLKRRFGSLRLMLPPSFYAPSAVAMQHYVLTAMGAISDVTLNHSYNLQANPAPRFVPSARNRANKCARLGFKFDADAALERAYSVIEANRRLKGYPLAMSLADLQATSLIIKQRCAVLSYQGRDVAAAISYDLPDDIRQLIYWGDVPCDDVASPMAFLAECCIRKAVADNIRYFDLGPSTSPQSPNLGLAAFKRSIGATATLKFGFFLDRN